MINFLKSSFLFVWLVTSQSVPPTSKTSEGWIFKTLVSWTKSGLQAVNIPSASQDRHTFIKLWALQTPLILTSAQSNEQENCNSNDQSQNNVERDWRNTNSTCTNRWLRRWANSSVRGHGCSCFRCTKPHRTPNIMINLNVTRLQIAWYIAQRCIGCLHVNFANRLDLEFHLANTISTISLWVKHHFFEWAFFFRLNTEKKF